MATGLGQISPLEAPQVYDVVEIAGVVSPGICQVSEAKRKHEWDVKKGRGTLGGTVTFVGRPPATFSITFFVWTPAHFQQWEQFRAALKYDPTKKAPQAVDIWYPTLLDIDINSVVVESIGNFTKVSEDDGSFWKCVVEFIEYFPPPKKNAIGTPSGSQQQAPQVPTNYSQSSQGVLPPSAQDQQQQEIGQLMQKASQP